MVTTSVKLHATQELRGRAVAEHIVKALSEVRVQVIEHQVNSSCVGVHPSEQPIDEGDEVNLSSTIGDRDDSLPRLGSTATNRLVAPLRTCS